MKSIPLRPTKNAPSYGGGQSPLDAALQPGWPAACGAVDHNRRRALLAALAVSVPAGQWSSDLDEPLVMVDGWILRMSDLDRRHESRAADGD